MSKTLMLIALLVGVVGLVACNARPEPLRVWTASDHAHPPDNLIDPTRVPQQERPDLTVGELIWQGQCARCHGPAGQGGGQVPVNFTAANWQAGIDDQAIARTIAAGKPPGMPAFGDLLSGTQIEALVEHIRKFGSAD